MELTNEQTTEKGLSDRIREACEQRGTTMRDTERDLGFAHYIHRWNEVSPSADKVAKVAEYLGVSIDYLMGQERNEDVEMLHSNPQIRMLLDATAKMDKSDVLLLVQLAEKMRNE